MGARILVVDDEPLVLKSISKALERVGYEVITAVNRLEFMDAIASGKVDLVMLDLHMDDITKDEIMSTSVGHYPDVRFLVISGSREVDDVVFIQKPFRISDLREKVKEILDDRP